MYYHRPRPVSAKDLGREGHRRRSRRDQEALVRAGRSHGVLVYDGNRPAAKS